MSHVTPSEIGTTSQVLKLWELLFSWIVMAIALWGMIGKFAFLIYPNWIMIVDAFNEKDYLFFLSVSFPIFFLIASVLLVLRSKWCFPLFGAHFLIFYVYFVYCAIKYGISIITWHVPASCMFEGAILLFCVHLIRKGALK
jgi:hypothetical protein